MTQYGGKSSGTEGRKKKRIMRSFKIDEISGVDSPAQKPALVTLMKRDGKDEPTEQISKTIFEGEHALTTSENGHSHLIPLGAGIAGKTSHDTSDGAEFGHSHPFVINSEGRVTIGEAEGHTHRVARTTKADGSDQEGDAMSGKATKAAGKDPSAEDLQKELQKMQENNERLQSIVALPADQKAHYDSLPEGDRDGFLKSSDEDRRSTVATELARKADADPVVYTADDGTEFRKSDDPRLVQFAKDRDSDRKELAKERRERLDMQLSKRAETELGHLPGELTTKSALLRAVDGIEDSSVRKSIGELLKAGDNAMAATQAPLGISRSGLDFEKGGSPEAELEQLAKEYAKQKNMDIVQARVDVLSTPRGEELYAKSVGY